MFACHVIFQNPVYIDTQFDLTQINETIYNCIFILLNDKSNPIECDFSGKQYQYCITWIYWDVNVKGDSISSQITGSFMLFNVSSSHYTNILWFCFF